MVFLPEIQKLVKESARYMEKARDYQNRILAAQGYLSGADLGYFEAMKERYLAESEGVLKAVAEVFRVDRLELEKMRDVFSAEFSKLEEEDFNKAVFGEDKF